jgi:hypothetical protein
MKYSSHIQKGFCLLQNLCGLTKKLIDEFPAIGNVFNSKQVAILGIIRSIGILQQFLSFLLHN